MKKISSFRLFIIFPVSLITLFVLDFRILSQEIQHDVTVVNIEVPVRVLKGCLLYTSDAADE